MAPMALMNMVSSNINQWTMLVAMLPIAYALALGRLGVITFDEHQRLEILLTIGQSLLGAVLLANMRFAWWEALLLFILWLLQFGLSGLEKSAIVMDGLSAHNSLSTHLAAWLSISVDQVETAAHRGKLLITAIYFAWTAITVATAFKRRNVLAAFAIFPRLMREHW